MDIFQAIILGIIQGITEFLPISSVAHLRLTSAFLGWEDQGSAFDAIVQIGTILAVLIYFRKDLKNVLVSWIRSFKGGDAAKTPEARMSWAIVVGTIPICILGYLLKDMISGSFRSLYVVASAMIGLALCLALAERLAKHSRKLQDVTLKNGFVVGLWQALALIPGMSRSGSTITGALFSGFERSTAARFSFLLGMPAFIAATVFNLKEHGHELLQHNLIILIISNAVSFGVGYLAIDFLMKFLQKRTMYPFVIYRLAMGTLILVLLSAGVLTP